MHIGPTKAKRVDANVATAPSLALGDHRQTTILQSWDVGVWFFKVQIGWDHPILHRNQHLGYCCQACTERRRVCVFCSTDFTSTSFF